MRLPALFRTTPFRLTLIFLGVFAFGAAAFLFYIYAVTAGEVTRRADRDIASEVRSLQVAYRRGGLQQLNQELIERTAEARPYLYLLIDGAGRTVSGSIAASPVAAIEPDTVRPAPSISR